MWYANLSGAETKRSCESSPCEAAERTSCRSSAGGQLQQTWLQQAKRAPRLQASMSGCQMTTIAHSHNLCQGWKCTVNLSVCR